MGPSAPGRIASVRTDLPASPAGAAGDAPGVPPGTDAERLAAVLLAGSPRVALVGPGHGRADARGWERRGGEEALARTLREAALSAGFSGVRIGVADVAVAADAAALLAGARPPRPRRSGRGRGRAGREEPGALIVPPGEARDFLAPHPLLVLPISEELRETLRALGLRRVGELAALPREELEARFGPEGLRAHRWACGEDDRVFRPLLPDEPPEASLELDGAVETLEPLLFVLRPLVDRVCEELEGRGGGAARLLLVLSLADGSRREAAVVPARPTRRARILYDLCRAALERGLEDGRDVALPAPVEGLTLRVVRRAPTGARQGDLFVSGWRDPIEAAAALSRLRARLGRDVVARPAPRADHRPETRSGWSPVEPGGVPEWPVAGTPPRAGGQPSPPASCSPSADPSPVTPILPPSALRLLPSPVPVRVRSAAGRPVEIEDGEGRHALVAAEGPERLSGDWWKDPYRREYFRACTAAGELLWIFREYRTDGALRWWIHGWWD